MASRRARCSCWYSGRLLVAERCCMSCARVDMRIVWMKDPPIIPKKDRLFWPGVTKPSIRLDQLARADVAHGRAHRACDVAHLFLEGGVAVQGLVAFGIGFVVADE